MRWDPYFSHGQLYVGGSWISNEKEVYISLKDRQKRFVYKKVFKNERKFS